MNVEEVYAIERPSSKLLTLYLIRSFLFPPLSLLALLPLYFRYHTLRYQFDDEGVKMSWGLLFRREVNLTYRRIQDIHLTSGMLQRWLGLADIHIQTASGSAAAEMTIEGIPQYEELRTFLYTRMRGHQQGGGAVPQAGALSPVQAGGGEMVSPELVSVLREIQGEIRGTREALEQINAGKKEEG